MKTTRVGRRSIVVVGAATACAAGAVIAAYGAQSELPTMVGSFPVPPWPDPVRWALVAAAFGVASAVLGVSATWTTHATRSALLLLCCGGGVVGYAAAVAVQDRLADPFGALDGGTFVSVRVADYGAHSRLAALPTPVIWALIGAGVVAVVAGAARGLGGRPNAPSNAEHTSGAATPPIAHGHTREVVIVAILALTGGYIFGHILQSAIRAGMRDEVVNAWWQRLPDAAPSPLLLAGVVAALITLTWIIARFAHPLSTAIVGVAMIILAGAIAAREAAFATGASLRWSLQLPDAAQTGSDAGGPTASDWATVTTLTLLVLFLLVRATTMLTRHARRARNDSSTLPTH